MNCKHNIEHFINCKISCFEDSKRLMLEISVRCETCKKPFVFVGLPPGLNLNGATVSVDGLTANMALAPEGESVAEFDVTGYSFHVAKLP